MPGIFREIADFIRYFRMPLEEKRVLIYSEHAGYTVNFRPIMEQLIHKHGIKICYVTSDPNDPVLNTKEKNVTVLYSRTFLTFLMGLLSNETVCVMTVTELNNNPVIKRSVNDVHYVYVFHALVSTQMIYRFGAFDHYDTVITVGPYQDAELRKSEELYKAKQKKLVPGGYTRLDDIAREYQQHKAEHPAKKERFNVLLAPSWGITSFVENHKEQAATMIESLVAEGFDVTLRYHPETVRRRTDILDFFDKQFGNAEHVRIEKSVAGHKSLLETDQLITDWSGVSLEYAFGTERPVLFIDTNRKIHNERYEELGIEPFEVKVRNEIGHSVSLESISTVPQAVREMIENGELYRNKIIEYRNGNIYHFGAAAEKTAAAIANI